MFRAIIQLCFGCRHRRMTRPITPVHKQSSEPGITYVACLDCGRQFHYDLSNMRMGTPIPKSSPAASDFQAPY